MTETEIPAGYVFLPDGSIPTPQWLLDNPWSCNQLPEMAGLGDYYYILIDYLNPPNYLTQYEATGATTWHSPRTWYHRPAEYEINLLGNYLWHNWNNITITRMRVNGVWGYFPFHCIGHQWPGPRPQADFTAAPLSGFQPLTVQFADTSTDAPAWWVWDFGDGFGSSLQNPSHSYADVGVYTVTLKAGNSNGWTVKTATDFVTVFSQCPTFSPFKQLKIGPM